MAWTWRRLWRLPERLAARLAWWLFIRSAHRWASRYMDQWEQVRFEAGHNTVYLTLSLKSEWPESFEPVDADGRASPRRAPATTAAPGD